MGLFDKRYILNIDDQQVWASSRPHERSKRWFQDSLSSTVGRHKFTFEGKEYCGTFLEIETVADPERRPRWKTMLAHLNPHKLSGRRCNSKLRIILSDIESKTYDMSVFLEVDKEPLFNGRYRVDESSKSRGREDVAYDFSTIIDCAINAPELWEPTPLGKKDDVDKRMATLGDKMKRYAKTLGRPQ